MKSILPLILLSFLFSSCGMLYFDRAPGNQVNEFPEEFRGDFISFEINPKSKKHIADSSGRFSIRAKSWIQNNGVVKEISLGEEVILSSYSNLYFLSVRSDWNSEKYWHTYILEKQDKGFFAYPVVVPSGSGRKQMRILRKNFSEVKLLDKKNGRDDFFVKMNEEQLLNYFQKRLRKANHYKFEPVK